MVPHAADREHDQDLEEPRSQRDPPEEQPVDDIRHDDSNHEGDDRLDVDATASELAVEGIHPTRLARRVAGQWDVDLDARPAVAMELEVALELVGHEPLDDL